MMLSDVCLTSDVCLSVAYIGPKSRSERPTKTKIGTEVAHVTRDSDTTFKVKRSNVKVARPLYNLFIRKYRNGPQKNRLDVGSNSDHVTLLFGLRWANVRSTFQVTTGRTVLWLSRAFLLNYYYYYYYSKITQISIAPYGRNFRGAGHV